MTLYARPIRERGPSFPARVQLIATDPHAMSERIINLSPEQADKLGAELIAAAAVARGQADQVNPGTVLHAAQAAIGAQHASEHCQRLRERLAQQQLSAA